MRSVRFNQQTNQQPNPMGYGNDINISASAEITATIGL